MKNTGKWKNEAARQGYIDIDNKIAKKTAELKAGVDMTFTPGTPDHRASLTIAIATNSLIKLWTADKAELLEKYWDPGE